MSVKKKREKRGHRTSSSYTFSVLPGSPKKTRPFCQFFTFALLSLSFFLALLNKIDESKKATHSPSIATLKSKIKGKLTRA
jgi:hypothetical protein